MSIQRSEFGRIDGTPVNLYTLTGPGGMVARITDYGATVTELHVPDARGHVDDVVLGFDDLEGYLRGCPYFGALVGRYANRIAGGRLTIDGVEHRLGANDGDNHLHGGHRGFDKVIWQAATLDGPRGEALVLRYRSPHGEEGYPGNLDVTARMSLTAAAELRIEVTAVTDRPTVVNITHHGYWNLAGHGSGTVRDHEVRINASRCTPVGPDLIPTGEIQPVAGTPHDFRRSRAPAQGGHDLNYVLDGEPGELVLAARVTEPRSGRAMEVLTTEPGIQFYDGHLLDGTLRGKGGVAYPRCAGLCLEPQRFPDSPNQPGFPPAILRPGECYRHLMVYRFSARD